MLFGITKSILSMSECFDVSRKYFFTNKNALIILEMVRV